MNCEPQIKIGPQLIYIASQYGYSNDLGYIVISIT